MRSHVLITLAGNAVPALAALVAFPLLHERLGTELFGFFMLAWASVGFSSLLDLGLGRAMTHFCALHRDGTESDQRTQIGATLTLLILMALLAALLGMAVVAVATALGCMSNEHDSMLGNTLLALGVPVGVVTSGIKGCLEGRQQFIAAAALRTLSGLLLIALPTLSAWIVGSPLSIAAGLLLARGLVLCMYVSFERSRVGLVPYQECFRPERQALKGVLGFTGWISVSTLAGSALSYMDRMALGVTSTLRQAAYYAAPFELVSRVLLVPGAVVTVLFPKISSCAHRPQDVRLLVHRGYLICLALVVPLLCIIALPARYWLSLWMGEAFSREAASVIHWLAPGIAFNAAAHIPVAALQALGHPGRAARVHLIEFLPALALFIALTHAAGATGAAAAWSIRSGVDLLLMGLALNAVLAGSGRESRP